VSYILGDVLTEVYGHRRGALAGRRGERRERKTCAAGVRSSIPRGK
jgi:hypothetical protein